MSETADWKEMFEQGFWDARYQSRPALWSGNPNPRLVEEAADLAPGAALDVGCGEGADAIWLARRGWHVTAVDISVVALKRGAEHAAAAGKDAASKIDWQQVDVLRWLPEPASFELVSAQFMQLPAELRDVLYSGLARSVRPGGTLLVVGHGWSDLHASKHRPEMPDLFFGGDDIMRLLDPGEWEIVTDKSVTREATDPDGEAITLIDIVVRARHRGRAASALD